MVPTVPSLQKICEAFGITLSQLFAGDEDLVSLTPSQRRLLQRWTRLNEEQQEIIAAVMDELDNE